MIPMNMRSKCGEGRQDGFVADAGVTTGRIPGVAIGATECTSGDAGAVCKVGLAGSGAAANALEAEKTRGREWAALELQFQLKNVSEARYEADSVFYVQPGPSQNS
ncbi:hypothetical protein U1Q18_034103 [Sarracenia purpurea var. burkii]